MRQLWQSLVCFFHSHLLSNVDPNLPSYDIKWFYNFWVRNQLLLYNCNYPCRFLSTYLSRHFIDIHLLSIYLYRYYVRYLPHISQPSCIPTSIHTCMDLYRFMYGSFYFIYLSIFSFYLLIFINRYLLYSSIKLFPYLHAYLHTYTYIYIRTYYPALL